MTGNAPYEDVQNELRTLAHWAKEARLGLIVAWSYMHEEREMPDRDKQVCTYIAEIVKRVEAVEPPKPPPTDEEMEETRKVIVASLDQRENRLEIERQQTLLDAIYDYGDPFINGLITEASNGE